MILHQSQNSHKPLFYRHSFAILAALAPGFPHAGPTQNNGVVELASGCAGCHGLTGHGHGALPSIAGKPADDFLRAMREFKFGARPATVMQRIAPGFTDAELEALAGFFADQP